jgi:hypothetical protein
MSSLRTIHGLRTRLVQWRAPVIAVFMALVMGVTHSAFAATRGLVIGLNDYNGGGQLSGAVADAHDIAAALRLAPGADVSLMIDAQATRHAVLQMLTALRERVRPGDFVVLTFAGLGVSSSSGQLPDVRTGKQLLLLHGFKAGAPSEYIAVDEVHDAVRAMDATGAFVLAVIDAGFGVDQVRRTDVRDGRAAKVRSLPSLKLAHVGLQGNASGIERPAPLTLTRSIVVMASAQAFTVPEVRIVDGKDGAEAWRGALSYAVARGLEMVASGALPPTLESLADYAGMLAYQMSDQRQSVSVAGVTRGVKQIAGPGMPAKTQATDVVPPGTSKRQGAVVPVAALDGQLDHFKGIGPLENAFIAVTPSQNPALLWDTQKKDVIVGGDVIAQDVTRDDIPAIVDRVVAVREIKRMTARSPQPIVITPSGVRHHEGAKVAIEIEGIANQALILFSIAGNGRVQLLYPLGSDPPIIGRPNYRLELSVQEPFGADQIVAITAPVRMTDIEQSLNRLKDRAASGQLLNILTHYVPANSRIGTAGIFTTR